MWIFVLSIALHIILIMTAYESYMRPTPPVKFTSDCTVESGTARLVLIVVEGLRADLAMHSDGYLAHVVDEGGKWGIARAKIAAHKPGFVAITAGTYLTPGSSMNLFVEPAGFDHIFGHTKDIFYFGSYVTPHYFAKKHFKLTWYKREVRGSKLDIYAADPRDVDSIIVSDLKEVFSIAELNKKLKAKLHQKKALFFMHFSSPSLAGYVAGVHDTVVKRALDDLGRNLDDIQNSFNNFYKDNKTVFVLTSDHGVTDWGSYGGGSNVELDVPVIVWGKGFQSSGYVNSLKQVDICPTISLLLNIPIPAQSRGVLIEGLTNFDRKLTAEALFCNALQLLSKYKELHSFHQHGFITSWVLNRSPFSLQDFEEKKEGLLKLLNNSEYQLAISEEKNFIQDLQTSYEHYDHFFVILLCMTSAFVFISWQVALVKSTIKATSMKVYEVERNEDIELNGKSEQNDNPKPNLKPNFLGRRHLSRFYKKIQKCIYISCNTVFIITVTAISVIILLEKWPSYYMFYVLIPLFLIWIESMFVEVSSWFWLSRERIGKLCMYSLLALMYTEILFWTFEIKYILCFLMVLVAVCSCLLGWSKVSRGILVVLIVSSALLCGIIFFPIIGEEPSIFILNASVIGWVTITAGCIIFFKPDQYNCIFSVALIFIFCITGWITDLTILMTSEGHSPNMIIKFISWCLLTTPLLSFLGSKELIVRLLHICLCCAVPLSLLSSRHEPIAYLILSLHIFSWMWIETKNLNVPTKHFREARRVATVAFYALLGYFLMGTTNELSSIEYRWTRCITTKPNEEVVVFLLAMKIILAFLPAVIFSTALFLLSGQSLERLYLPLALIGSLVCARHAIHLIFWRALSNELPKYLFTHTYFICFLLAIIFGYILLWSFHRRSEEDVQYRAEVPPE